MTTRADIINNAFLSALHLRLVRDLYIVSLDLDLDAARRDVTEFERRLVSIDSDLVSLDLDLDAARCNLTDLNRRLDILSRSRKLDVLRLKLVSLDLDLADLKRRLA